MNMMKADGDDAINVRRRRRRQGKGTTLNLRGQPILACMLELLVLGGEKKIKLTPIIFLKFENNNIIIY